MVNRHCRRGPYIPQSRSVSCRGRPLRGDHRDELGCYVATATKIAVVIPVTEAIEQHRSSQNPYEL
jgi:hypothetical protein